MIQSLTCKNFKSLGGSDFEFRTLTLLTGTNSSGKSTLTQAVLLARLAACENADKGTIPLNGPYELALGSAADIFPHNADVVKDIGIHLVINGNRHDLRLSWRTVEDRSLSFSLRSQGSSGALASTELGEFSYLSAGREGPKDSQPIQSEPREARRVGTRGEHVAEILSLYENEPVEPFLEHSGAKGLRLGKQVEAWLGAFVPSVQIRTQVSGLAGIATIEFKSPGERSEWMRPSNVGFGVTYCLPVVVAVLLAGRGSIVIVDTPEAHLHPAAQSALGRFLALAAANGIQVILETHSDHILNGVRLAVADGAHPLHSDGVIIHHLGFSEGVVASQKIKILENGSLSERPRNFFDQSEIDLAALVRKRQKSTS